MRIGTLSKALGSIGGFVVGPTASDRLALQSSSTAGLFHSAARRLPPSRQSPRCGSCATNRIGDRNCYATPISCATALRDQGWSLGASASQIIPIEIGDPGRTMWMAQQLRARGLLVPGIRPPTVPVGQSRLRISLSYLHSAEDQRRLLTALSELRHVELPASHVRPE